MAWKDWCVLHQEKWWGVIRESYSRTAYESNLGPIKSYDWEPQTAMVSLLKEQISTQHRGLLVQSNHTQIFGWFSDHGVSLKRRIRVAWEIRCLRHYLELSNTPKFWMSQISDEQVQRGVCTYPAEYADGTTKLQCESRIQGILFRERKLPDSLK